MLANGFSTNNLLGARQEIIMVIFKKANKQVKGKLSNLQSIGIIVIKSKETRCGGLDIIIILIMQSLVILLGMM